MIWRRALVVGVLLGGVLGAAQTPVRAAGWHRDEQGAKATALGQAVVAHADDPSAVYYNPAGLAFIRDRAFYAGFSLGESLADDFSGLGPIPGIGVRGERAIEPRARPHLYWVEPVAERWAVGVALHQPVGFETDWERPDGWSGRFESRHAGFEAWDLEAVAAVKVRPSFGVSAGLVLRSGKFSWDRNEFAVNPASMNVEDVGRSVIRSERDLGVGAVLALQHRPPGRWSWGLRWRRGISTDLNGEALYLQSPTGDPAFDALVAGQFPFAAPIEWSARLRLPDRLSVGVAYAPTPTSRLELDLDHTGWDSMNGFGVGFPGRPALDRSAIDGWRDRLATRIGLRWYGLGSGEWRAGLFLDPTPQPESDLGPFFVGADRLGASIGYGTRVRRLQTDLALVWEEYEKRSTTTHGFNGRYATRLLRLVLSFGW